MQHHHFAVAHDLAGSGGHGLQRFNGGFGLALLEHAQDGVQQNNSQDDDDFSHLVVTGQKVRQGGDTGCHHQNNQHGVLELCQEALQQGGLFGFLQLVGAIFGQTFLGLGGGEALCTHAEVVHDFFGGLDVGLFHQSLLLLNCYFVGCL